VRHEQQQEGNIIIIIIIIIAVIAAAIAIPAGVYAASPLFINTMIDEPLQSPQAKTM
jgi:flagellar basal body-associated protein FliL